MLMMMMKVFTEHLGPEGTHQGDRYQTRTDSLNPLMLNNGQKYQEEPWREEAADRHSHH